MYRLCSAQLCRRTCPECAAAAKAAAARTRCDLNMLLLLTSTPYSSGLCCMPAQHSTSQHQQASGSTQEASMCNSCDVVERTLLKCKPTSGSALMLAACCSATTRRERSSCPAVYHNITAVALLSMLMASLRCWDANNPSLLVWQRHTTSHVATEHSPATAHKPTCCLLVSCCCSVKYSLSTSVRLYSSAPSVTDSAQKVAK